MLIKELSPGQLQQNPLTNGAVRDYAEFLASKLKNPKLRGIAISPDDLSEHLYPFQRQLVSWALAKGRCALFADTGLGKTRMQLEWAYRTESQTIIFAPLAVAQQTVAEARLIGIDVEYVRAQKDVSKRMVITNYEMAHAFDLRQFDAVVLDESSILKSIDSKTRQYLTDACDEIAYRLCCTATPAPNDIAEFANHAEFLGIASRQEMLSMFFVHDDNGWRLKGHAREAFYRWMSTWVMMLRTPADIGFKDKGYVLPELTIHPEWIPIDPQEMMRATGQMFFTKIGGITGRAQLRRSTIMVKVSRAVAEIQSAPGQWIVWHGLNDEGRTLHTQLSDSVLVEGADSLESKIRKIQAFIQNDPSARVLITKPSIAGFGLNLQNCHQVMFLGMNDSYEQWYQAIRRCWRFGQRYPVRVVPVLTEMERTIYDNVRGKESKAKEVIIGMIKNVAEYQKTALGMGELSNKEYDEETVTGAGFTLMRGDCVARLRDVPDNSIDFSVFSPPFLNLYVYSASERDIGNNRTADEFFEHFRYFLIELLRTIKPGRNVACHVAQVPATLTHDGFIGLKDFRGDAIRAFINAGFIHHGEIVIDKDPQAQAIRTKAKSLLFVQLKKDASWLRPALADFILVFRKPGENAIPIHPDLSNEDWIEWARPIWYNIRESNTLNVAEARSDKDERHIAPLQLETIERCIRLWSNPGETILSPFAGIGSEIYQALMLNRQAIGIELKSQYYETAKSNIQRALERKSQGKLI